MMRHPITRAWALGVLLSCLCVPAQALILVGEGNKPMGNRGWPTGCEKVTDLPSRLGWWEGPPFGGGEWHFSYGCKDTEAFSEAVERFAAIRTPALELVVHDGPPGGGRWPGDDKKGRARVAWTLTVWCPANWHRLHNNPQRLGARRLPGLREPVPPPRIDVFVGKDGPIQWDAVVVPDNLRVIDQRKGAQAKRPAKGVVRGAVYDMATGQVVAGAEVRVVQPKERDVFGPVARGAAAARGTTDARGAVEIGDVPAGRYLVCVRADGFAARVHGYYDNAGATRLDLVAELCREVSVAGVVTDSAGEPLAGVEVAPTHTLGIDGLSYLCPEAARATTDANGRFDLRGLPRGYVQIRCRGKGLHPKTSPYEIYGAPAENLRLVMARCSIVRGTVEADPEKLRAHKVQVYINPQGGWRVGLYAAAANCDPNGRFEFKNVPPGDYLLSTRHDPRPEGDDPAAVPLTVDEDATHEVLLRQ